MFTKLLVALDDSTMSRLVFQEALELAKLSHASLHLLHVLTMQDQVGYTIPAEVGFYSPVVTDELIKRQQELWREEEQKGQQRLRSLQAEATEAGVLTTAMQVVGDPGRQICQHAVEQGIGLIVIGRRGRSGLGELLMGSVSNYVMHHAHCSVLVVQGGDLSTHSTPASEQSVELLN